MPLVEIEFVGDGPALAEGLARRLADELGRIFASPAGQTWVRIHSLPLSAYAENGTEVSPNEAPIFVKITRRSLPSLAERELEAGRITAAVAAVCARSPERIHVCYEPPAEGRQAFGGQLVR